MKRETKNKIKDIAKTLGFTYIERSPFKVIIVNKGKHISVEFKGSKYVVLSIKEHKTYKDSDIDYANTLIKIKEEAILTTNVDYFEKLFDCLVASNHDLRKKLFEGLK